ncbi:MAG: cytochrome P450 [Rhizobiales bacterium]|nr:cytochrome P450 [Hyphomicrobiales bacterium]MBO6697229.1 cytochrome P450 [Hyphomicrobiales bacterium]MBO6736516.1 cytochrome P450 [Hyphomicrobiales bacterium]MBO6912986.1 cytochrome P450 [Hyphomicrobiales bacterium]MBO6954154.1 cytochrome P450 [Hyphomicrobiales bacterium]
MNSPYLPPRPVSLPAIVSLIRVLRQGDGDLLSLLPNTAYRDAIGPLGYSRRSIVIANDPALIRQVLNDEDEIFPKSDLMVNATEALIGDSIFVSSGDTWRRQRAMIDPAFTAMRINRAFGSMSAGVDEAERHFDESIAQGRPLSLDKAMGHMAADIICRTVFSSSLKSDIAHQVFDDFAIFERSVAQVEVLRLIFDKAWTHVPQKPDVLAACARIRSHLGTWIDEHCAAPEGIYDDIASAVIAARDADTGEGFTREELIDQLGVFFLAGHETTASALTWAVYLLAMHAPTRARMRAEVEAVAGDDLITIEHTKKLTFTRNMFRETLRLYPPITFLPRVALENTRLGKKRIKKGALVMIAPWVVHRHQTYWKDPDVFDPDRFSPEREAEMTPGCYIPFGQGHRLCSGAAFATIESTLFLARLVRGYDIAIENPDVRPVARMTTRPNQQIMVRMQKRH